MLRITTIEFLWIASNDPVNQLLEMMTARDWMDRVVQIQGYGSNFLTRIGQLKPSSLYSTINCRHHQSAIEIVAVCFLRERPETFLAGTRFRSTVSIIDTPNIDGGPMIWIMMGVAGNIIAIVLLLGFQPHVSDLPDTIKTRVVIRKGQLAFD